MVLAHTFTGWHSRVKISPYTHCTFLQCSEIPYNALGSRANLCPANASKSHYVLQFMDVTNGVWWFLGADGGKLKDENLKFWQSWAVKQLSTMNCKLGDHTFIILQYKHASKQTWASQHVIWYWYVRWNLRNLTCEHCISTSQAQCPLHENHAIHVCPHKSTEMLFRKFKRLHPFWHFSL